eukprot:GILJ01011321.1.p1 GENE.GILJ01011321.1~~GILJ01011321.1.p1  ORF type:complete len:189 (-),score=17.97 GILJ01011321.1:549-1055(-)
MEEPLYHERQSMLFCAVHALNNLFQHKTFSRHDLDCFAHQLAPDRIINPHKNLLGVGNYDVNVLMLALHRRGKHAEWFDSRHDIYNAALGDCFGLILNIPTKVFRMMPVGRHWLALKKVGRRWYNLDSKLKHPVPFETDESLKHFLHEKLQKGGQLILIKNESSNDEE